MNNTSITEKYALCMLKEKKKLYDDILISYLFISMIVEMMLDDNLEIENNKVKLNNKVPVTKYNKIFYEMIKKLLEDLKKEEISIQRILNHISYSLKKRTEVIDSLKEEMVEHNLLSIEHKKWLLGDKEQIVINEEKFHSLFQELREEFLENRSLQEDYILLGALLNSTRFLKKFFTKYDREILNQRIKEIKDSPIADKVKFAEQVISDTIMMVVVVASTLN